MFLKNRKAEHRRHFDSGNISFRVEVESEDQIAEVGGQFQFEV